MAATWNITGSMSISRGAHTATLLANGKVLIAGGYNDDNPTGVASCELYDPATGLFTPTGSMVQSRYVHTAVLLANGKVLVAGGLDNFGGDKLTCELYDPGAGTWALTGSFIGARAYASLLLLPNNKAFLCGADGTTLSTHLYDSGTGLWTPSGNMAVAQSYPGAALLDSGRVLLAGSNNGETSGKRAELYTISGGTWASTGNLNTGSNNIKELVVLDNGKALIAGGYGGGSIVRSRAELYDPNTLTWALTGSMATNRWLFHTIKLDDGTVLAVGGYSTVTTGFPEASCELYDSGTGLWTAAATMNNERAEHSVTRLDDGSILAVGGFTIGDSGTESTATAEIYAEVVPTDCTEATALYILGTGWPILYDIITDPVEEIEVDIEKKIVHPGTQRTGGFVDIYALDKYRSIQITSAVNLQTLPAPQTFVQTHNIALPALLLAVEAIYSHAQSRSIRINEGFGSATVNSVVQGNIVTKIQHGFSGAATATVIRTFLPYPPTAAQTPQPLVITPSSGTAYLTTEKSNRACSIGTTGGFAYVELSDGSSEVIEAVDVHGVMTGSLGFGSASGTQTISPDTLATRGIVLANGQGINDVAHINIAVNETSASASATFGLAMPPSCPAFLTPGTTFLYSAVVEKWRFGIYVQTLIYVTIPTCP